MSFGFTKCPICQSIMDEVDYRNNTGDISGNKLTGIWYYCRNKNCGYIYPK